MQTITKEYEVFEFEELSERAQERAYNEWYKTAAYYEWWDYIYEDFKAIGETFGLTVTDIEFELGGRSDGAIFVSDYEYKPGCRKAIREYAPLDEELHGIVDALAELQRPAFYQIVGYSFIARNAWPYGTNMAVEIDTKDEYIWPGFMAASADKRERAAGEKLTDIFRDLAHWLYKRLDQEYEYITSMESFLESIEANEWQFEADGSIF